MHCSAALASDHARRPAPIAARLSLAHPASLQAELTRVIITMFFRFRSQAKPWLSRQRARNEPSRSRMNNTRARASMSIGRSSRLAAVSISLHCWQGDDVGGFEESGEELGGGLAVTGQYPGKARTADELRGDLDKTFTLCARLASLEPPCQLCRDAGTQGRPRRLEPEHFQNWIEWAKSRRIGMDFNPTFFAHPLAAAATPSHTPTWPSAGSGSTTASPAGASARAIGKALGTPCVTNVWIPDGSKDSPIDRAGPRQRLADALDAIFAEPIDPRLPPRRRRGQALRHRLRELRRRLARVLPRLCRLAAQAPLPRRRPLPSDRSRLRQDLGRAHVPRRDPAARQPRRALG